MAQWQKRRQGGGQKTSPDLSIVLSVKQGQGYIKGPSFGLWSNDQGGPSYRGTLKEDYLAQVLEFLSNAYDSGLPVSLALFKNDGKKAGGFPGKQQGFKKAGNNPFKKGFQKQEPQPEEGPDQPAQNDDIPF